MKKKKLLSACVGAILLVSLVGCSKSEVENRNIVKNVKVDNSTIETNYTESLDIDKQSKVEINLKDQLIVEDNKKRDEKIDNINNVDDLVLVNKEEGLPYEALNIKTIDDKGFEDVKDKITYKKVKKDYLYKGVISMYRINYVDGFKAILTDTGKSAKSIGVNFEGVLLPRTKSFVPLGIDKEGNIFLVGEMTEEEPHNSNNN